jgi:tRNA-5-methyluridine54 2-sulfurtransferase
MKCRVCGKPAHIRLPQYNRALCSDDFIAFFEKRVLTTIRKYGLIGEEDKTLVAVSGGKDSLSLWNLLNRLGFSADGIYIDLGIHEYSRVSFEKTKAMADRLQRTLYSFSLSDTFTKGIKDLSGIMKRPPCSLCGMIKRYVMNRACTEHGYSVLATGHNLDDEASALLGNLLHWKEEYLWKKGVVLGAEGSHLAKKVKPLFLCSEKEAAAYAVMSGIDYVYEECPYSVGAKTLLYKSLLNRVEEESPATKLMFMKGYLKRVRQTASGAEQSRPKSVCSVCGYPSFAEQCNFCRLTDRFGSVDVLPFHIHAPALP